MAFYHILAVRGRNKTKLTNDRTDSSRCNDEKKTSNTLGSPFTSVRSSRPPRAR